MDTLSQIFSRLQGYRTYAAAIAGFLFGLAGLLGLIPTVAMQSGAAMSLAAAMFFNRVATEGIQKAIEKNATPVPAVPPLTLFQSTEPPQ